MENKVILPKSFYETQDKPDQTFVGRMQRIDSKLIVYWNRFRGRWIIDRFTCDYDGHRTHDCCPRVNVHVVQTEDGNYHPLNDRVLEWLRKADVWNQDTSPEEINRKLDEAKAAFEAGEEANIRLYVRDGNHDEHLHSDSSFPTAHPRYFNHSCSGQCPAKGVAMAFRFYNGGDAGSHTLAYSIDDRNGFFPIRMGSQDFFEVPETIRVGGKQYFTNFDQTVPTRLGQFGVVRVDPEVEETAATGRVARTDKEARKIGDEIHRDYLISLVQDYQNRVEAFRSQGFNPLPAQGYVKYALKKLNIADPAEPVRNFVAKGTENDRIAALEEQLKALMEKKA